MSDRPRIATVDLNPGVDRVIYLDAPMQIGHMNRAAHTVLCQGSKALNQAILYTRLGGCAVEHHTFTGGPMGEALAAFLPRELDNLHATLTQSGVRTNTKVIDPGEFSTELNEKGGPVCDCELSLLMDGLWKRRGALDVLSLAGSIPQGVGKSVYRDILAQEIAPTVVLDCAGEALSLALSGPVKPSLIKPNRDELFALCRDLGLIGEFSPATAGRDEIFALCRKICAKVGGATEIIVTLDADGSLWCAADGSRGYAVSAPRVPFRGFSGAGDTYLAAFVWAREIERRATDDALRLAAAAASAKVALEGTTLPDREAIEGLVCEVEIDEI